jgi:SAM-dependent methyltransferase
MAIDDATVKKNWTAGTFGSAQDTRVAHLLRKVVYSPLTMLECIPAFRKWRAPFLLDVEADGYALFERTQGLHGGSMESSIPIIRKWCRSISRSRVLILACGQGREISRWKKEGVGSIVGQELLDFSKDWRPMIDQNTSLVRSYIEQIPFKDQTFDIVFTRAVLEHLSRFEDCVREMYRVMRTDGLIWADFGPLWYTYGGPHDPNITYEQVTLSDDALAARFTPGSEGELYWLNGMFSRLRLSEYREILSKYFNIRRWHVGISGPGMRYRRAHPETWTKLCRLQSEADLLLWAVYFLGAKRSDVK